MEKNQKTKTSAFLSQKMTRKEAIKKTGVTALTAASLMFLTTNANAAASPVSPNSTKRRR